MNHIACFLKQFRKVAITITAFSNKCLSYDRERALTLARARAVAHYLWGQGLDSRLLFARGLGSQKPILTTRTGGDNSINSRVEITFRRVIIGDKQNYD